MDLASADAGTDQISVFIGAGAGTFQSAVQYVSGLTPVYLVSDDMNHDGHLDLIVANFDSNNIAILSGKGDGTFEAASYYGAKCNHAAAVAVADFDENGNPDLAIAGGGWVVVHQH